jgi:hypothetical protein
MICNQFILYFCKYIVIKIPSIEHEVESACFKPLHVSVIIYVDIVKGNGRNKK